MGSTVTLFDNGEILGTAPTDADGSFSYTTRPLVDGTHSFTATATDTTGNVSDSSAATTVAAAPAATRTLLAQNFPNPFNPETWIPYALASDAHVSINIFDVRGHLVRRLNLGYQKAGFYMERSNAAYWDGRDSFGQKVASGLYFYTLQAGEFKATRRMVIMK